MFVGGLSGGLLFGYVTAGDLVEVALRLCAVLSALAVLWHIAVRWVERQRDESGPDAPIRRLVGEHVVGLCSLGVAGIVLGLPAEAPARVRLALTLCLVILLVPVLLRCRYAGGPLSRYAVLGLLGGGLWLWLPHAAVAEWRTVICVAAVLAAAAALLAAVWPILRHWQYRRRVSQTEPQRLTDPPAQARGLSAVVVVTCVLVGMAAVLAPAAVLTPIAVVLAALAVLTVGHWRRSDALGEIGLALLGETIIVMVVAWLPASQLNALAGCGLAGVYLLWLSRFWQQQLRTGVAWTTAGRLIPAARRLGYAAGGVALVLAVRAAVVGATNSDALAWQGLTAALLLLLLFSMLVRTAAVRDSQTAAAAACVAVVAAIVPARAALTGFDVWVPWPTLIGGVALVLALRAGAQRGAQPADAVYNAHFGGILPVAALFAATVPAAYGSGWVGAVVTAGGMLLAIGLRWRRGLPRPETAYDTHGRRDG